ncbi:hypothetical protein E2C01_068166 [Portunus trituberculatus]|uniref:Uncharacterized protein n=1 Tax=Portunus trituberculatus TaxID=210409 RepID=A0A5B7HVT3_PORTR|nr:hypothetical protein [Portunus trituberculatus]
MTKERTDSNSPTGPNEAVFSCDYATSLREIQNEEEEEEEQEEEEEEEEEEEYEGSQTETGIVFHTILC